jgi:hydroxymethylpyrimidine pyrophosphatase-like HAD family hydrolase
MNDGPVLVASDLDGTLLGADGALSEHTARTWRALWDQGIHTVLVTARPPRWIDPLGPIVGDHGVAICLNGAFVYDAVHHEILTRHGIGPELLHELVADLRSIPGATFSAELGGGFHREADYPVGSPLGVAENAAPSIGPLGTIQEDAGKLLVKNGMVEGGVALSDDEFLAEVRTILGDRALLSVSCAGLAEIGPAGITKAGALAQWGAELGIEADAVWAFGDMPNDIPMLSWAGVGWAVGNAHPDVLAVADRVCGPNSEDGVAEALAGLLG